MHGQSLVASKQCFAGSDSLSSSIGWLNRRLRLIRRGRAARKVAETNESACFGEIRNVNGSSVRLRCRVDLEPDF